ncbi:DUF2634 domain-containing protein [Anaerosporobacter sp.]|uniref:DUF2634 domain-containing protein n=1 Tax=Anaerosporobacter sp. TaxID=1872529 RepID=UPI00286EBBAD|nr:DUF2634 domain-containing protein [Anaerosporobacter sp.]
MLPSSNNYSVIDVVTSEIPSKTFFIDFTNNKIVGSVDGLEAVKQAVFLILNTERYENMVYSWDYGFEKQDLIGMPEGYAYPELKRRIAEALMQDARIVNVDSFTFEKESDVVTVSFVVTTEQGIFKTETEVSV